MARNDKLEARKMLAYLGWVDELPIMKKPIAAMGGVTVPVVVTDPLEEKLPLEGRLLRLKGTYHVEMTDDDHGIFHLPYPAVGREFVINTHPYEWALVEIAKLDPRLSIDYAFELPVMVEADAIDRLKNAVSVYDTNMEGRNLLVRSVRDAGGDIDEMAQAMGLSKFRIYQILQKTEMWDAAELDLPTSVDALRAHCATVEKAERERERMMGVLMDRGVVLAVLSRCMGVSMQRVKTMNDKRLERLDADS